MKLTNFGLVEFVKTKLGIPYVYGMKGEVMTQANFNYLQRTYGVDLVWNSDEKKVGKVCVDCSGLISWYIGKNKSSSQFKLESSAHPISSIASAPTGAAVWRNGHIGVYIGNGLIIEARGSHYGVVQTKVKERDFTHWFLLNDIDYIDVPEEKDEIQDDDIDVKREIIIVNGREYELNMIRKDGNTFIKTRDIAELLGIKVSSNGCIPIFTTK